MGGFALSGTQVWCLYLCAGGRMTASWRVSQDQRVPRFGYCLTERKAGVGEAMTYCSKTFLDTGGSGMEDGSWLGRSGPGGDSRESD